MRKLGKLLGLVGTRFLWKRTKGGLGVRRMFEFNLALSENGVGDCM